MAQSVNFLGRRPALDLEMILFWARVHFQRDLTRAHGYALKSLTLPSLQYEHSLRKPVHDLLLRKPSEGSVSVAENRTVSNLSPAPTLTSKLLSHPRCGSTSNGRSFK